MWVRKCRRAAASETMSFMLGAFPGGSLPCRWNQTKNDTILYSIPCITDSANPTRNNTPSASAKNVLSASALLACPTSHKTDAASRLMRPTRQNDRVMSGTFLRRLCCKRKVMTEKAAADAASAAQPARDGFRVGRRKLEHRHYLVGHPDHQQRYPPEQPPPHVQRGELQHGQTQQAGYGCGQQQAQRDREYQRHLRHQHGARAGVVRLRAHREAVNG
ncbi:MAG: hypothetical protein FD134_23 [Gallionellaceae bacterium]|nr:MAG: hypothetical protein FD134_23 [Gallionellaceae bacterium]